MDETVCISPAIRRTAWGVWIALAVVVSVIVVENPNGRSVTPNYHAAVSNWFAGDPLYNMGGSGFVYAPPSALVFAPWSLLPRPMGDVLWRWTILGALAAGVYRLTRLVSKDDRWFLINSIATASTAAGCARNGQSTILITGLMVLAAAAVIENRWWRATLLLCLALAFKPVAFVMLLVVGAVYPQMLWRLAIGMVVLVMAPFLTQSPDYVASQYVAFVQNSRVAYSDGDTGYWTHLYGMLKVFGVDTPQGVRQASRTLFAAGTVLACWLAARKLSPARSAFYLCALSNCYLMLFNSRTEGSTYAMVGMFYGILLAEAWLQRRSRTATIGYLLAVIATAFNYDIAKMVTPPPREIWLAPFVCCIISIDLCLRLTRELQASTVAAPEPLLAGRGQLTLSQAD